MQIKMVNLPANVDTKFDLELNHMPENNAVFYTYLVDLPGTSTQSDYGHDIINHGINKPSNMLQNTIAPPYRMPPQPPPGTMSFISPRTMENFQDMNMDRNRNDASIPGAANIETTTLTTTSATYALRTHSSKFPIERELILSTDKSASKIPIMYDTRSPPGPRRTAAIPLLQRSSVAVAPDHPPKQIEAWNTQTQHQHQQQQQQQQQLQIDVGQQLSSLTGAIPRAPARLPEDVTALAERENGMKDRDGKDSGKNPVTKTYHTLKDLISSKFKKDSIDIQDELNNVTTHQQQHQHQQQLQQQQEDYRSPYYALPAHMRQVPMTSQSQSNIWNGRPTGESPSSHMYQSQIIQPRSYNRPVTPSRTPQQHSMQQQQPPPMSQQRAASQPQLNMAMERRGSQTLLDEKISSNLNMDITDSDEGGFATHSRRLQMQQLQQQNGTNDLQAQQLMYLQQQQQMAYQRQSPHNHLSQGMHPGMVQQQQHQQHQQQQQPHHQSGIPDGIYLGQKIDYAAQVEGAGINQFQPQQKYSSLEMSNNGLMRTADGGYVQKKDESRAEAGKQVPESAASSDYDKSGNQSSNVDSGRGSAAYSSGRKPLDTSPESSDALIKDKENTTEWIDVVDAELRNILEPGMKNMTIGRESALSGSVSSMSPPLPPLSPESVDYKSAHASKQEYGTDSYNRPGRSNAIGPSRAGWPGSSVQKQGHSSHGLRASTGKKHEQNMLKRHLFGLDADLTSTTTRSLDLESLLGTPWGAGQSVSDSETDTQGLRHIRSQLEGLETMYSEVLKMLGTRMPPGKLNEASMRSRRRHGSLSSLPSSSVSGRPTRDKRRTEERRKVRDIKGINKRFQRLESHVVTLARSVAHLSSEMRSQHFVTQELESLRNELAALRMQSNRSQSMFIDNGMQPEAPNLTNPKRVRKLTKFFGEDPPLMRLFLKKLGYEKYATLFEAERVGMIELPYLGEERLQKLGVPLGPRLRILQEAQISLCKDKTLCIV